ncbi:Ig-like domain-containing protein [Martelella alba]|uniref:Big-1 domain-containing protein n=1 Tax=Martelella alba TaxID=2590451 RepID=A0ABY2SKW3_9HYPH|nr:Ig-like domain-containing protein [Martelella alba]TKI06088.1 hypothetical protein FCN80_11230 [Martelella alba]
MFAKFQPEPELFADYSLSLVVTSDNALANGSATNAVRATLRTGNIFLDKQAINFELFGSALFANGTQQSTVLTNSLGNADVSFTNTVAESPRILASYRDIVGEEVYASQYTTFQGGVPSSLSLNWQIIANNAPANNTTNNLIAYTVRDAAGNPVDGELIDFVVTQGQATLSAARGQTNNLGVFELAIRSGLSGPVTVRAALVSQPNVFQFTEVMFSAVQSAILAVTVLSDHAPANGLRPVVVRFTLMTLQGQPWPQQQLTFTANNNASLSPTSGLTNNNGQIDVNIVNQIPGQVRVSGSWVVNPTVKNNVDVTFI